jgi:hypothetical protein
VNSDGYYTFSQAMNMLNNGLCMARAGWNGKGMFVFKVPGSTFVVNRPPLLGIFPEGTEITYRPHYDMRYADGSVGVWLASHGDMAAYDWYIVENPGNV